MLWISGNAAITNGMAKVTVDGLECGVIYTIIAGGILNHDLVGPESSHGIINDSCISFPQGRNKDDGGKLKPCMLALGPLRYLRIWYKIISIQLNFACPRCSIFLKPLSRNTYSYM